MGMFQLYFEFYLNFVNSDSYENSFWADRNAFRILSPEGAKKMRYYRTAWINRRFFNYMLFLWYVNTREYSDVTAVSF